MRLFLEPEVLGSDATMESSRRSLIPSRYWSRIALALGVCVTGLAIASAVLFAHYYTEIREARRNTPELVAAALATHGAEVELAVLSLERERILLMVQDPAFRRHRGVDLATPGAGMTTLTQGLVKQLYFPAGFRQGVAKVRQTLIAQHALDALVSKDEQLELFLNIAYVGHHEGEAVHGFAHAARAYYGKEFIEISDDEYLSLVAALINPNSLKPGTPANQERVVRIRQYIRGEYHPAGVMDLEYRGGEGDLSFSTRKLVTLLRLITDARPSGASRGVAPVSHAARGRGCNASAVESSTRGTEAYGP